jgi:hypothetical protein
VLRLLVALALAHGAHSPQEAVHRFIQWRDPQDACAQLAPHYRHSLDAKYGACESAITHNPKATHLQVVHASTHGETANVDVSYHVPSGRINERFSLERIKGIWLITGAR